MNLYTIFMFVMIGLVGMTLLSFTLDDVSEKNVLLDEESTILITELQTDISTNLELEDVDTEDSNLTLNSTFEGTDDFSRQYREERTQVLENRNRIEKVTTLPSIVVKAFGVPQNDTTAFLLTALGVVLGFIILLAIYIAIKTGEVNN